MINDNVDKVMPQADGKVPARRFPEFRNSPSWQEKKIGKIVTNAYSGGTPLTTNRSYYTGDIPFIRSAEIGKDDTELRISEHGLKNSSAKMVEKGDILIALYGANSGDIAISRINGAINQAILCLRSEQNHYFIFQSFLNKQNIITSNYLQGGQGNLSGEIVKSIKIELPLELREQEKIAECLSSVDALIGKKQTELESLKKYKDGLLQQLFPQGNNNLPALRFPEFKNSPPWQETKLERICRSISSGRDKRSDDGNYDLFGSTGIIGKTSDKTYNGKFILVARVGANAGLLTKVNSIFGATDNTLVIDLDDNTNIDFIFASLDKFRLNRLVFGSGQPLITGRQLKDISISLPDSTEQKKIANCLTSLDNLIEIKQQELDKLSRYKKGLLQQLLVQG